MVAARSSDAPVWMVQLLEFRQSLFLRTVEPVIQWIAGPLQQEITAQGLPFAKVMATAVATASSSSSSSLANPNNHHQYNLLSDQYHYHNSSVNAEESDPEMYIQPFTSNYYDAVNLHDESHRRLDFLPDYVQHAQAFKETSMSFATLMMLFLTMSCVFLVFLSCFYHNQKTSPFFISPRRHRLPQLVPPPLPVDGYFTWVKVCLYMSDEEIIRRVGYDSLIFLRFHRLALRCIVKMSVFSFVVLLPLNFTGGGRANAQDLREYVGSLFFTDFLRFTMANVMSGSPRLWVHCFAAYLLTGIVVLELLKEYEHFALIRHRYLLSREPHLRTVLVTNIPRHLRSSRKITNYFKYVYPNAIKSVFMCQNCVLLEQLLRQRRAVLDKIERELLLLCRREKRKLFEQTWWKRTTLEQWDQCRRASPEHTQERLTEYYTQLEQLNGEIHNEQRRRRRVMKVMDKMESGEVGAEDLDYVLAHPYVSPDDPVQRRILGLPEEPYRPPLTTTTIPEDESVVSSSTDLRSRSPQIKKQDADSLMKVAMDGEDDQKKQRIRPLMRAKNAIRQYGRSSRDLSFLGRPLRAGSQGQRRMEDHINEVTDKAFVIMQTYTAATIAIQSMHSSKPGSMQVATAPEPRDVLWENIYLSKGAQRTRSYIGEFVVLLLITVWVVPVALVSLLVSESALVSSSPRLAQLDQATAVFSAAIAMVQPLCIVALQQLLPPLFIMVGRAEGRSSFSDVQMSAFSHYFLFQVLNVFLVTTIAGSIFDTIAIIIEKPESAFEMLGNSLPRMSSFFISFVMIKTFLALGFELVRTVAIVQGTLRYIFFPNATLRRQRNVIAGMRAIDDPGWFPFHKILAQDMLVVVISVVFAVVAPLVLLPCALFCLFSRIMWTHHHLYVYEASFESGGMFWPKIFRRFVFGLIIAQMTITGQFILKDARHEAYATAVLMFVTYFFLRSTRARYDPTSATLPLEVATVMDMTLRQEQEQKLLSPRATGDEPQGGMIGDHDPFKKAYLQPALRANPNARPEQPFPPAQLGNEEEIFQQQLDDTSTDAAFHDSTGTVKLKNLNQNERQLINRWWKDQFQRAGRQDLLSILTGEACGTLTLSHDVVHHPIDTPPTNSWHSLV